MLITLACPQHFTGTKQDVYYNKRQKLGMRHVSWYPDILRVWGVMWCACPEKTSPGVPLNYFLASADLLLSHSNDITWTVPNILKPGHGVYCVFGLPKLWVFFSMLFRITNIGSFTTAQARVTFILLTDPRSSSWRVLTLLYWYHHLVPLIAFITFPSTSSDSPGSQLSMRRAE